MTSFKSAISRLSHKSTSVFSFDLPLDSWCRVDGARSPRTVEKVEICTALATGEDAWHTPIDKTHSHTLLRISLQPVPDGPQDSLLIERVLSTGGVYHSVTHITEKLAKGGTLMVHDRVCVVSDGPAGDLAHDLEIERTISFDDDTPLTLVQFAQILSFVSQTTMLVCAGGDSLTPKVPPPRLARKGVSMDEPDAEVVDDSVFELNAEAFLGQVPRDSTSVQALRLIGSLKDESRGQAKARFSH